MPFLRSLVDALCEGRLVPGFALGGDPATLADATIYVPTRRAARALRGIFVERLGGRSAILPVVRPLGDFDEDAGLLQGDGEAALDLAPPMPAIQRLMLLAPLVRAWKRRIPGHVAALIGGDVVAPASTADAIWLARDLAALIDEIETEEGDWTRLAALSPGELAGWWQMTLEFLSIVTKAWPDALAAMDRSNPGAHRTALIDAEAERLVRAPPRGPVVAAGSTGSIPATARLLAAISTLPTGAVVLPGLDFGLDAEAWSLIGDDAAAPSAFGHPQYGLKRLLGVIGVARDEIVEIGAPPPRLARRGLLLSEAMRPAETTDRWSENRAIVTDALAAGALDEVGLIEAANEREEALAIAIALREGAEAPGAHVALVSADRELARRVSSELLRFGIRADDSGGVALAQSQPGALLTLVVDVAFRPGDPAALLALLKHPLVGIGRPRAVTRRLAELVELVALRGGVGRPDIVGLAQMFDARLPAARKRKPFWADRFDNDDLSEARAMIGALVEAFAPLTARRATIQPSVADMARASVAALEAVARDGHGAVTGLYGGDQGEALATLLRDLVAADAPLDFQAEEWPAMLAAFMADRVVKPSAAGDPRVSIWGALEARLQNVDLLVVGGLNEGTWPRQPQADRFLSRLMKAGLSLEPPERRIGLAAHDFMMAFGNPRLVLARAARAGDAPAVASRWLQRLDALVGPPAAEAMRSRGSRYLAWARAIDAAPDKPFAVRPAPKPPIELRPSRFSVTEIETLRRDPYAVHAKRVLGLELLEPLVRDPGAAERGTLFHEILHRLTLSGVDPRHPDAMRELTAIGARCFEEEQLPADVLAVWWPRFEAMAPHILAWEKERQPGLLARHAEVRSERVPIGATDCLLSGTADRIEERGGGIADILDYKTGYSPSKGQAHTLLSPQLALEAALLARGGFPRIAARQPGELVYVRLRPNGEVREESILTFKNQTRTAADLSDEAWQRLERLMAYYRDPANGYLSRALPFKEGETDGDYDHLARVLEWSAGADAADVGEASE